MTATLDVRGARPVDRGVTLHSADLLLDVVATLVQLPDLPAMLTLLDRCLQRGLVDAYQWRELRACVDDIVERNERVGYVELLAGSAEWARDRGASDLSNTLAQRARDLAGDARRAIG